jgi:hypothetical protein
VTLDGFVIRTTGAASGDTLQGAVGHGRPVHHPAHEQRGDRGARAVSAILQTGAT